MKIGAVKLAKWLNDKGIRPSHFAKNLKKFPSTIHRILDDQNCPDIHTATEIEKATKGYVLINDWLVDVPKKPTKALPKTTSGAINRK